MNNFQTRREKVRFILSSAYREKEKLEVDSKWKHQTMKKIRNLDTLNPSQALPFIFQQLFIRFSTTVVLTLVIGLIFLEAPREYKLHQIFYEEPFDKFLDISMGINI